MNEWIVLLRGINVGGRNPLPMAELRGLLEELGCEDVRTSIQSGNAVVRTGRTDPTALARELREGIETEHGFVPQVLVLTRKELETAILGNPFPSDDGKALHVYFLESPPEDPDLETLRSLETDTEAFELGTTVFYLYAPDGIGRSKLAARVERCLGVPATARNWNTVRKLAEIVGE